LYRVTRILKETFSGVRADARACLLKIFVLTVTITTVTCGVLVGLQGNHVRDYWEGRTDVNVYLCTKTSIRDRCSGVADSAAIAQIGDILLGSPAVKSVEFENREAAWNRFTKRYNTVNLINSISMLSIPESYRVKVVDGHTPQDIADLLTNVTGVDTVTSQEAALRPFMKILRSAQIGINALAGIQILWAVLLLGHTTRATVRHRRSELEVMRLVGASRWRVRAPFIMEHFLEMVIGSLLAYGALWALHQGLYQPYVNADAAELRLVDIREVGRSLLGVSAISSLFLILFSAVSLRKITR